MVGLQDLPAELLLQIFDHPGLNNTLYHLSTMSKTLHYRCLPVLLQLQGVDVTEGVLSASWAGPFGADGLDGRIDVVSSLRVALFVPKLQRFEVTIYSRTYLLAALRREKIEDIHKPFRRFQNLLMKLSSVDTLVFSFLENDSPMLERSRGRVASQLLQAIHDLLLVACTKAKTLKLSGTSMGGLLSLKMVPNETWIRIKHKAKQALDSTGRQEGMIGVDWEFRPRYKIELSYKRPQIPPNHSTTALSIQQTMFLEPPMLGWTVNLLNTGRVSKLELLKVYMENKVWSRQIWPISLAVIGSVAGTHLTELIVSQCNIHPRELFEFLCFLPKLTSLTVFDNTNPLGFPEYIYRKDRRSTTYPPFKVPRLQSLVTLSAPEWLLNHFFVNLVFPSTLRHICLYTSWSLPRKEARILRRLDDFFQSWDLSRLHEFALSLDCRVDLYTPANVDDIFQRLAVLAEENLTFLHEFRLYFSIISFDQAWERGLFSDAVSIIRWFETFRYFPNVPRIAFDVCTERYDGHLTYLSLERNSGMPLQEVVKQIMAHKEDLESLKINGREFIEVMADAVEPIKVPEP